MSKHTKARIFLFLLCCLHLFQLSAYNLRRIYNANGLSNSAVLSLCQDYENFIWMGTCDGLHLYDGVLATPISLSQGDCLSGSVIEDLLEAEKNRVWVLTNYGVDRVDTHLRIVTHSFKLKGGKSLKKNARNDVFVVGEDNTIYYVCLATEKLRKIKVADALRTTLLNVYVDDSALWAFTEQGIRKFNFNFRDHEASVEGSAKLMDPTPLKHAFVSDSVAYTVDNQGIVCEYNLKNSWKRKLFSIEKELTKRGNVSDIIAYHDSYFIAFQIDGVVKAVRHNGEYRLEDLGISSGIFCLQKDRMQDVVWIGTDGQGVFVYSDEKYSVRSFQLTDMDIHVAKPVRAIFMDKDQNLWLGTKGAGLFKVRHFDISGNTLHYQSEQFLSPDGKLGENMVYAFEKSRLPLFWIGTDEGIRYYSYPDKKVDRVPCDTPIRYIHDLYEESDTILWISTVGTGVVRARVVGDRNHPRLEVIKRYTIENGTFSSNFFFTLYPCADGRILFGNRGRGLFTIENDELRPVPLKNSYHTSTVNDVLSVKQMNDTVWIGTNYGLIMQHGEREVRFGRSDGFSNNVVHAIEEDRDDLWLATNQGLLRFDKRNHSFQCYNNYSGLEVIEYSDGASLRTQGCLLFGGTNGVTLVKENPIYKDRGEYLPPIVFLQLRIEGEKVNFGDYATKGEDGDYSLKLAHHQNTFSVSFATPNYIDVQNYEYYYRVGDGDSKWINNWNQNIISFIQMAPADYTVYVKYKNRVTGTESKSYKLHVLILPPWYLNGWMKSFYVLLVGVLILFVIHRALKKQRRERQYELERMEREHRDEVYEEKLRFFTNITHEFCTPLTLIYAPCERILNYERSDLFVKKYVNLIRDNAERLNNLIQEVIEFRRLETGHKVRQVSRFSINDLFDKITPSFMELAECNQIHFSLSIEEQLSWNTDMSCFEKVAINLISNAFKYTLVDGVVRVKIDVVNDCLRLSVYNTGKGVKEEDKKYIFNRYSVLNSIEENRVKKLSARNGLGLAICHSMVELLEGNIEVESEVDKYAEFIVYLPWLKQTVEKDVINESSIEADPEEVLPHMDMENQEEDKEECNASQEEKQIHILAIDDNEAILSLLKETLTEYRLSVARNAEEGMKLLKADMPHLIITDIMMPGVDGVELTRQLKGHKHTMHIPLIILSAKNTIDEQVEGIVSGADAYISKPFSLSYLRAVINRLIANRDSLKEYYNSSASAFEFMEGKLLSKEDKALAESVHTFVNSNIDNADLSAEDLAGHLGVSVRALYRKFKELDLATPKDFIKDQRMILAVKLLQTTTLNVQEIIYRCGFNNRSHFYKEFSKKYDCSPKEYRTANKQKDNSMNE